MKALFTAWLFLIVNTGLFAQDASSFFPSSTGFKWTFEEIPLDSSNNEIDSLTVYKIDSFTLVQNYKGRTANVILTKTGPESTILSEPFSDTNFVSFSGSEAYYYFELFNIDSILEGSSSNSLAKITDVKFKGWYSFYRFAEPVNQSYDIFSVDSTLTIDSTELDLRFTAEGIRLPDENIQTDIGSFDTKKFVINNKVFLLLGSLPVEIFTISDTVWIASGNWIVKESIPSNVVDLLGIDTLFIPGFNRTVTQPIVTEIVDNRKVPLDFNLFQNYPNPFNPSTTIKYSVGHATNVKLKIYNILGNEVAELVNKVQPAGEYKIKFNPSEISGGLTSGVYFYSLEAGSISVVKKLIYLK